MTDRAAVVAVHIRNCARCQQLRPCQALARLVTVNVCPECGSDLYATVMERASDRRDVSVLSCTGCEHIEEV